MFRGAVVGVLLVACSSSNPAAGDSGADGRIDAPPPACVPFDITVPSVSGLGRPIWTGSEYLVPVQTHPGVIQRIAADGTVGATFMLGGDVVSLPENRGESMTWTGSELGFVFAADTGSGISFTLARYRADGSPIGTSTVATVPTVNVGRTLRWAGDRYLLGWAGPRDTGGYMTTIEEVSADGVPGATSTFPSDSDLLFGLATNATTHLAAIGQSNTGPQFSFVAIDRATGATSQHAAPYGVNGGPLIAREHDFVTWAPQALLPNNSEGTALEVIDATGMATMTMPIPDLILGDMISMSYGYHLVTPTYDQASGGFVIQDVDLGPDGLQIGAVNTRATIPAGGSETLPTAVSRGNGLLTSWATGPNVNTMTARLIQDCVP